MHSFLRYFIYSFSMPFTLFLAAIALILFDDNIELNGMILLLLFLAVLVYAVPVSLIISIMDRVEAVNVVNDRQGKNIGIIDKFIKTKTRRTECIKSDRHSTYYIKNRFWKWLTNEITIYETDDIIIVSLPKMYKEKLKKRVGIVK